MYCLLAPVLPRAVVISFLIPLTLPISVQSRTFFDPTEKGEAKSDIESFLKSNALRKLVKDKRLDVVEIDSQILTKKIDLKQL